jgi:hypothetical protein
MSAKYTLALAVILMLGATASADLTFYGPADRATFDVATMINILETFDLVEPKDKPLAFFESQGVTYTGIGGLYGGNVWVTSYPYPNFSVAIPDATVLTATGDEDFTVAMSFVGPVTAVGFDTYRNNEGPVIIQVENSDGWTATSVTHDPTTVGFFGVTSSSPITAIRWTSPVTPGGYQQVNTGIDNVQIGVVPVPGAVLLGLLGLGAAGAKLRKRA